jgi:hypothetical protein
MINKYVIRVAIKKKPKIFKKKEGINITRA